MVGAVLPHLNGLQVSSEARLLMDEDEREREGARRERGPCSS